MPDIKSVVSKTLIFFTDFLLLNIMPKTPQSVELYNSWFMEFAPSAYRLDAGKTLLERNVWGQYATPPKLADEILEYAETLLPPDSKIRFLDPPIGTGAFYSSLLKMFSSKRIERSMGFEKDERVAVECLRLWESKGLDLHINDFTLAEIPQEERDKANLVICNPPYIRHHHLSGDDKARLKSLSKAITDCDFGGLTGYYAYFMAICHVWMAQDAVAGWLIPSEFMDVNYGREIKKYLLSRLTLLRIPRYDPEDVQFDDALVSSSIVWFTNTPPAPDHEIEFTFGGSLKKPEKRKFITTAAASTARKWTILPLTRGKPKAAASACKLSDLFTVKRGLATGANEFFILSSAQVAEHNLPAQFLTPILPSSRYLKDDIVEADSKGNPIPDQKLYLLNCSLPEEKI